VVTTEAGPLLCRHAREVLARTDTLQRQIDELSSEKTDHVIVSVNQVCR
jgi:hypothetical protein